jgi:hypothetical protein
VYPFQEKGEGRREKGEAAASIDPLGSVRVDVVTELKELEWCYGPCI